MLTQSQIRDIPVRFRGPTVLALVAELWGQPVDLFIWGLLKDSLQDAGASPLTATRTANRVRRAAMTPAKVALASAIVNENTPCGEHVRGALTRSLIADDESYSVLIVAGGAWPRLHGRGRYATYRGTGDECLFPGTAARCHEAIDWHESTYAITAGADWVIQESLRWKCEVTTIEVREARGWGNLADRDQSAADLPEVGEGEGVRNQPS